MSTEQIQDGGGNIVDLFDHLCSHYSSLWSTLTMREDELEQAQTEVVSLSKVNSRLQSDCSSLRDTVEKCQQQLSLLCTLEEETRRLKEELCEKERHLKAETHKHRVAMETLVESHRCELEQQDRQLADQYGRTKGELEAKLKTEEEKCLQLSLNVKAITQDKDKEIVRLTMEYENKLTKAQCQRQQFQQQQQQLLNKDMVRKKMEHMKAVHQEEVNALQSEISVLQSQLLGHSLPDLDQVGSKRPRPQIASGVSARESCDPGQTKGRAIRPKHKALFAPKFK